MKSIQPKAKTKYSLRFYLLSALILGAVLEPLTACAPKPPPPSPAEIETRSYFTHYVTYSGETLAHIANWYTGNSRNWERILDANPGLNVRRIQIGQPIRIPRSLLVREDTMPRSAVATARTAQKPAREEELRAGDLTHAEQDQERRVVSSSSVTYSGDSVANNATSDQSQAGTLAQEHYQDQHEQQPDSAAQNQVSDDAQAGAQELSSDGYAPQAEDAASHAMGAESKKEIRTKTREELLRELLEE